MGGPLTMSKAVADEILNGWPDILTPADIAALYRVNTEKLYRWDEALKPFRTPTGLRRYHKEKVAAAIATSFTPARGSP